MQVAAYYQTSKNMGWKNRIMPFEMEQGLLFKNPNLQYFIKLCVDVCMQKSKLCNKH